MQLARPATLAVATAIAAPALWHAFGAHDLPATTALLRFLIAVPVSAAMLAVLRSLTAPYRQPPERIQAVAERLDASAEPASAAAPAPASAPGGAGGTPGLPAGTAGPALDPAPPVDRRGS